MEKMQRYMDAFTKAADRTRSTYVIILAFSVVCLAAFLNSSDFGWHRSRQHKLRVAYAYLLWKEARADEATTRSGVPGAATERAEASGEKSGQPAKPAKSADSKDRTSNSVSAAIVRNDLRLSPQEVDEAKEYLELTQLRTSEEVKMVLGNVEKQVSDSSVVQLPLFGLSFHLNDLGLVSGIALLLLVLLLKYALTREVGNLVLAFDRAREFGVLNDTYEALSTNEVLHRPEALSAAGPASLSERKRKIFFRPLIDAPVVLLFVPVVAYTLVTANDFRTWRTGTLLSPIYAVVILLVELVTWILITFLVVSCLVIIFETRRLWRDVKIEIETKAIQSTKNKSGNPTVRRSRLRASHLDRIVYSTIRRRHHERVIQIVRR